jgi:uncharacterized damage-inducible protein DinB
MTNPALFHTMARYNAWMNGKVYDAAATLSEDERKADRGAFFGSIHATLDHILLGDRAWMNRLGPRDYPVKPIGQPLYDDFAELRAAREAMDADILAWTETLTPEWLAETYAWTSTLYGGDFAHPRWGLVQHMFNHQTHHRGQATTLLSQAGLDVGPTDMPAGPIWPDR